MYKRQVHDAGQAGNLYYIAMEYVDGLPANRVVEKEGPLPEDRLLSIARDIASALASAHDRKIFHRDVKPDNIMLASDGRALLADLGIARFGSSKDPSITDKGIAIGSPHYMSPEQVRGAVTDARSDLYSLGASLYFLASGRTPFSGASSREVMGKHLTDTPRPLGELRPGLSPRFVSLVGRLMARDPDDRFGSAKEVVEAVDSIRAGRSATNIPVRVKSSGSHKAIVAHRPSGRDGGAWALAVAAGGVAILIVFVIALSAGGAGRSGRGRGPQVKSVRSSFPGEAPEVADAAMRAAGSKRTTEKQDRGAAAELARIDAEIAEGIPAAVAAAKLGEFLERFPDAPQRAAVEERRRGFARQHAMESWKSVFAAAEADAKAGRFAEAVRAIEAFGTAEVRAHVGKEIDDALMRIRGEWHDADVREAEAAEKAGDIEKARKLYADTLARLRSEPGASPKAEAWLSKELERVSAKCAAAKAAASGAGAPGEVAEAERWKATAAEAARLAGTYRYDEAAAAIAGFLDKRPVTETIKAVAGRLRDRYSRIHSALEAAVKEVASGGAGPRIHGAGGDAIRVVGADTRKIVARSDGRNVEIPISSLTKRQFWLLISAGTDRSAGRHLALAAAALDLGFPDEAESHLSAALARDPSLKTEAAPYREELDGILAAKAEKDAEETFARLNEAIARGDRAAASAALNRLKIELKDTKFVAARSGEIEEAGKKLSAGEAGRAEAQAPPEKRGKVEELLAKAGFVLVSGTLAASEEFKDVLVCEGGEVKLAPDEEHKGADVDLTISLRLKEDGEACVWVRKNQRFEKFDPRTQSVLTPEGSLPGLGYGFRINRREVTAYVPLDPTRISGPRRPTGNLTGFPKAEGPKKLSDEQWHTLRVTASGRFVTIFYNGQRLAYSNPEGAYLDGDTEIEVKGGVQFRLSPVAKLPPRN
ncbi:MAG: serine/threonine protein kinase [Planctomycetota bacterium]|nr:serine/threonine protein kinase [Planctomycetota bacterium]